MTQIKRDAIVQAPLVGRLASGVFIIVMATAATMKILIWCNIFGINPPHALGVYSRIMWNAIIPHSVSSTENVDYDPGSHVDTEFFRPQRIGEASTEQPSTPVVPRTVPSPSDALIPDSAVIEVDLDQFRDPDFI